MKTRLLFWGSVLFFYLGFAAREGNLYYFFAVYLLMSTVGLHCRKRESEKGKPEAARHSHIDAAGSQRNEERKVGPPATGH